MRAVVRLPTFDAVPPRCYAARTASVLLAQTLALSPRVFPLNKEEERGQKRRRKWWKVIGSVLARITAPHAVPAFARESSSPPLVFTCSFDDVQHVLDHRLPPKTLPRDYVQDTEENDIVRFKVKPGVAVVKCPALPQLEAILDGRLSRFTTVHWVWDVVENSVYMEFVRRRSCPTENPTAVLDEGGMGQARRDEDTSFTEREVEAIVVAQKMLSGRSDSITEEERRDMFRHQTEQKLESLGVHVYRKTEAQGLDWSSIAGYSDVKSEIEDTIVLSLRHPEIYDEISKGTRARFERNRPRAVLFEGPPGTGKTTTARVIASLVDVPLVYVPLESIVSKWYGESEKQLSQVFDECAKLGDTLIFVDEIDALAQSRDTEMHEASRRVLSVLLRKVDGFQQGDRTILIGATNRSQDLDAALVSRFDVSVRFDLPNQEAREGILGLYAKHLVPDDLRSLGKEGVGLSGRNLKDACELAERRWASKRIRGEVTDRLPPSSEYVLALRDKKTMAASKDSNAPQERVHWGGKFN